MGNPSAAKPQPRIVEFEGLRGCLAWWVVLFHLGMIGRFDSALRTRFETLVVLGGWQGVELFIILSGFVIAVLLEAQRETFRVYIVRRFFRLAPVYYVLLVYAAVLDLKHGVHMDRPLQQFLVHLTLLHGLVPDELLMGSANAFVHPAWSISVEWQFYLIAPWALAAIRRSATRALGLLLGCVAVAAILVRSYSFPFEATVFMRAELFGMGIASYYLYRSVLHRAELAPPLVAYLLPVGLTVVWVFHTNATSVGALWLVVFSTVLAHHAGAETFVTRPLQRFLVLRPLVWLGKLSYCTYLCHMFVLMPIVAAVGPYLETLGVRGRFAMLLAISAPVILAVSVALHYLVEQPGIQLGKWLVSRSVPTEVVPVVHPGRPQRV